MPGAFYIVSSSHDFFSLYMLTWWYVCRLVAGTANPKSAVGLLSSCFRLLEDKCFPGISNLACMEPPNQTIRGFF